jgi:hypothetical protein
MAIIKKDGTFVYHDNFPNTDFSSEGSYVIDENTDDGKKLTERLILSQIKPTVILDENGNILKVEYVLLETKPIQQQPTLEDRVSATEEAINLLLCL